MLEWHRVLITDQEGSKVIIVASGIAWVARAHAMLLIVAMPTSLAEDARLSVAEAAPTANTLSRATQTL